MTLTFNLIPSNIMVPWGPPKIEQIKILGIVGSQVAGKFFSRSCEFALTLTFDFIPSACFAHIGMSNYLIYINMAAF